MPKRFVRRRLRKRVKRFSKLAPKIRLARYRGKSKGFRTVTNRGKKLMLQQRMQSGTELPQTTFSRMFWRGSGCVNFSGGTYLDTTNNSLQVTTGLQDQTFLLNSLNRVVMQPADGFKGDFSFTNLYHMLYSRYLCLGATARFRIQAPVWPVALATTSMFEPSSSSTSGFSNPISDETRTVLVPFNPTCGFWYMRYCYFRKQDIPDPEDPLTQVIPGYKRIGHPMGTPLEESRLWPNMRSFLSDPSVNWKRDFAPKVNNMGVSVTPNIRTGNFQPPLMGTNSYGNAQFLGNSVFDAANPADHNRTISHYNVTFSRRPVFFRARFSLKKNLGVFNPLLEGNFHPLPEQGSSPPLIPEAERFLVRIGYVCWDASGTRSFHVPLDRIYTRSLEMEVEYFCALKGPKHSPWTDDVVEEELTPEDKDSIGNAARVSAMFADVDGDDEHDEDDEDDEYDDVVDRVTPLAESS